MRTRSILLSLVAAAAVGSAVAPASAEPLCLRDVDCVDVVADPVVDGISAQSGGACAPASLLEACAPPLGLGSTAATSTLTPSSGHPFLTSCGWVGGPGSKIDFGGTLRPVATSARPVTVDFICFLRVNGVRVAQVRGVEDRGTWYADDSYLGPSRGARVVACLYARVAWSDGTSNIVESGGSDCVDEA